MGEMTTHGKITKRRAYKLRNARTFEERMKMIAKAERLLRRFIQDAIAWKPYLDGALEIDMAELAQAACRAQSTVQLKIHLNRFINRNLAKINEAIKTADRNYQIVLQRTAIERKVLRPHLYKIICKDLSEKFFRMEAVRIIKKYGSELLGEQTVEDDTMINATLTIGIRGTEKEVRKIAHRLHDLIKNENAIISASLSKKK